jgi:hypothetical protein
MEQAEELGTQFTCFTCFNSTKVRMLTYADICRRVAARRGNARLLQRSYADVC